MHFGESSLFITMAGVLHAFFIEPPRDEAGRPSIPPIEEVEMKEEWTTGMTQQVGSMS